MIKRVIALQIILDDCFSGHQTFELFDVDMVEKLARKFKVKKSTPLSEFYAMLASHFVSRITIGFVSGVATHFVS